MTVYCNISECGFNQKLEEPHQRKYGVGYVPIGNMSQYSGKCVFDVIRIRTSTVQTSQTKHIVPVCDTFSEDETALSVLEGEHMVAFCDERRCLHFDKDKGCMLPADVYVGWHTVVSLGEKTRYPVCTSFSNRGISGHIDWSKSGTP